LTLVACGGDSAQTGDGSAGEDAGTQQDVTAKAPCPRGPTVTMSKAEIAKLPPLTIPTPSGPPPRHLKIVDLRKGSGPGVPKDDLVTNREKVFISYFDVSYPVAQEGQQTGQYGPEKYLLENIEKGFGLGLIGMKVGGRREIVTTPKLVYPRWKPSWGYTPFVNVYVVDLLGMEPPPDRRVEYLHGRPC
jgi:peptidylprolyl isomerase